MLCHTANVAGRWWSLEGAMLEEVGGESWRLLGPRPPSPAGTLPLHGVMAGRVQGISLALAFLWQVALGLSGQICSSITHPDAELALQGTSFPRERLLEGDLWGCVRAAATQSRGKVNPESFITRMGPPESLLGSWKMLGVGLRTGAAACCLPRPAGQQPWNPPRARGTTSPGCFRLPH